MGDHILTTTLSKKSFKSRYAVCFGGLRTLTNESILRLTYRVALRGESDVKSARYLRKKLLPALNLPTNRVRIGGGNYTDADYEVAVTSHRGDRMDEVYILTSIFRNFRDNRDNILAVEYLIRKGVDPLAAFAIGREFIYCKGKMARFSAGFHYVIYGNIRANYAYLLKFKDRKPKSNILENTGPFLEWPAPRPTIDGQIAKERTFNQEEWVRLDKAVKNEDVNEINKLFKEVE